MRKIAARAGKLAWILGAGLALAGCTESRLHLGDEFGRAVRQDAAAQIADPDAHHTGAPPAGSDGERAGLAMLRYQHNAVIPPPSVTTSSVAAAGGGAGGGGGAAP
jgi:hypothetical protein